jgi:hypothetical protein
MITGIALTIGIVASAGVFRNAHIVDEVKAASGAHVINFWDPANLTDTATSTLIDTTYVNAASTPDISDVTSITRAYQKRKGGIGLGSSSAPAASFTLNVPNAVTSADVYATNWTGTEAPTLSVGGSSKTVSLSNSSIDADTVIDDLTPYSFSFTSTTSVVFSSANKRMIIYQIVLNPSTVELSSISVSGELAKTSYYAGESFDPTGLTITANYDDESSADVTSECSFSPDPLTAGVTSVTASYTEGEVTKTVSIGGFTVSTRILSSLEVTSNPTKMDYMVGQIFDPTGMVLTATYNVGSPVVGYTNYSYSPTGALNTTGTETITITSLENSLIATSLQVQVSALTSMTIVADDTGAATSGYNTYTFTKSGVQFTMVDIIKNGNNIQFRSGTFSMHNATALPGSIVGITVNRAGGTPTSMTLYTGSTSQQGVTSGGIPSAYDSSSTSFSWEVNGSLGHNFFRLFNFTGSSTLTFSSIEIEFFAEPEANEDAIAWGTDFLSATATGCSALDQSQLLTAWSGLETSFNALSNEAKNYLTSLTPNVSGNDAQHAVARYIYIITKYGDATFTDFMSLDIQAAPSVFDLLDDGYNYVPLIAVIGVVGLTVLIGYYYLKKRQEA